MLVPTLKNEEEGEEKTNPTQYSLSYFTAPKVSEGNSEVEVFLDPLLTLKQQNIDPNMLIYLKKVFLYQYFWLSLLTLFLDQYVLSRSR